MSLQISSPVKASLALLTPLHLCETLEAFLAILAMDFVDVGLEIVVASKRLVAIRVAANVLGLVLWHSAIADSLGGLFHHLDLLLIVEHIGFLGTRQTFRSGVLEVLAHVEGRDGHAFGAERERWVGNLWECSVHGVVVVGVVMSLGSSGQQVARCYCVGCSSRNHWFEGDQVGGSMGRRILMHQGVWTVGNAEDGGLLPEVVRSQSRSAGCAEGAADSVYGKSLGRGAVPRR